MERLTKRLPEDLGAVPIGGYGWPEIASKLAQYEDAEEQGRLIVLPCKVGDSVYYIDGGKRYKAKAAAFKINKSGVRVYCERNFMGYIGFEGIHGKTVFFSRAEAEKALAGEVSK